MVLVKAGGHHGRSDEIRIPNIQDIFHDTGTGRRRKSSGFLRRNWSSIVFYVILVGFFMLWLENAQTSLSSNASLIRVIEIPRASPPSNGAAAAATTTTTGSTRGGGGMDATLNSAPGGVQNPSLTTSQQSESQSPIDLERCASMTFTKLQPKPSWTTKPLWLAGYPRSGGGTENPSIHVDNILPRIIEQMTNAKVASDEAGKCQDQWSQVAVCTTTHPMAVGSKPLKRQAEFNSKVILTVRDFTTAFPAAHHQRKLSEGTKQVDVSKWRSFRDFWFRDESFEKWKHSVMWWINQQFYTIELLVAYEHLFDSTKGPLLAKKIGQLLLAQGFSVVPLDEVPCIWHKVIQEERERQTAYFKYLPAYKPGQIEGLKPQLQNFRIEAAMHKNPRMGDMMGILDEYMDNLKNPALVEKT